MSIFYNINLEHVFEESGNPRSGYDKVPQIPLENALRFSFGIVSNNTDPSQLGRVKISFPHFESSSESDWAPIVRPFANDKAGMCVIPDVGDKVICAFINDNVRLPVVLGVVFHKKMLPPLLPVPGNEKKIFSTPSGAQVLLEDFMGLEKITIASGNGKMKVELSAIGGLKILNTDGNVEIESKIVEVTGMDNGNLGAKKELKIKVGGEITIESEQNLSIKAKKDNIIKGKKIKLDASSGVTAKMKQIATKGDQVIGIDMHDELMPSPSGLAPLPLIPNPYLGEVADKVSKNVFVKGKEAATKGSKSNPGSKPGHIVIPPGVQFKKPPNNKGEISSGTEKSVKINDKETAVILSGVKTCSDPTPKETSKVFPVGFSVGVAMGMVEDKFKKEHKKAKQNQTKLEKQKNKKAAAKKQRNTKSGQQGKKTKFKRNMEERRKTLLRDADDPKSSLSDKDRKFIKKHDGKKVPKGYEVSHKKPLYTKPDHTKHTLDKSRNMETMRKPDHRALHKRCGITYHKYPPSKYKF